MKTLFLMLALGVAMACTAQYTDIPAGTTDTLKKDLPTITQSNTLHKANTAILLGGLSTVSGIGLYASGAVNNDNGAKGAGSALILLGASLQLYSITLYAEHSRQVKVSATATGFNCVVRF